MVTPGTALLGLGLLLLVVAYLARPFLKRQPAAAPTPSERARLIAEKEALLTQIVALDFDNEMGKVAPEVYESQRGDLIAAAAVRLEKIENTPRNEALLAEIEAAIARMRAGEEAAPAIVPSSPSAISCPNCRLAIDTDDKFCANCGHKLSTPVAEAVA